jgi:hypothetical protein
MAASGGARKRWRSRRERTIVSTPIQIDTAGSTGAAPSVKQQPAWTTTSCAGPLRR